MTLQAGIGKTIITPNVGAKLVGYSNRPDDSKGVHDELCARALVIDNGEQLVAICSVELLWLWAQLVNEIRDSVAKRCSLKPENILIACTHTHGGPAPHNKSDWDTPVTELIADAIVQAYEALQPAQIGFGFGFLSNHSINRRWLNRPIDPSVGIIRVDKADGQPPAIVGNYACHAVVMGYDNYYLSGDWPGYSSRLLEDELGDGTVALFTQGGAGDINPLTETVRQRLDAGHAVGTIGYLTSFYGEYQPDDKTTWNIEDRGGGTFLECETLARAYNREALKVWKAIKTSSDVPIWIEKTIVNNAAGPEEKHSEGLPAEYHNYIPEIQDGMIPMEIMLLGIGSAILVTQPGEVFSETAVALRKAGQQMGYGFPWLVSYANGSFAYLPPANAFAEGGYEVQWALRYGLNRSMQDRITDAITPILKAHKPAK